MIWPESRTAIETGFEKDLTQALFAVRTDNPEKVNEQAIETAVSGASEPWLETTSQDAIAAILLLLDNSFGSGTLLTIRNTLANNRLVSSQAAAQMLGRQVAANTRLLVDKLFRENFRRAAYGDPGAGEGGLTVPQQRNIFGPPRARRIAITETTRMAELAERSAMDVLRRGGVAVQRVWETSEDEKVCPICRPLHGLPSHKWPSAFRNGPPGHVHCRCTARIVGLDELIR